MLIYHPALDPYHSAFRMLQILAYAPERHYGKRELRVLDFYAVFPHLIPDIRLRQEHVKWKKNFRGLENPYWFNGEPKLVFTQMEPLQEAAQNLLYAQGLTDPSRYPDRVKLMVEAFARLSLPASNSMSDKLLDFLVNVLSRTPFNGRGGLKERTGLLDHRYDAI